MQASNNPNNITVTAEQIKPKGSAEKLIEAIKSIQEDGSLIHSLIPELFSNSTFVGLEVSLRQMKVSEEDIRSINIIRARINEAHELTSNTLDKSKIWEINKALKPIKRAISEIKFD